MNGYFYACAATSLLAASALQSASAQTATDREPIAWHIDAGYGMVASDTADFLDDGWGLEGGLTWHPAADMPFTLRADLRYLSFDVNESIRQLGGAPSVTTRVDDGDATIVGLNLGGTYQFDFSPRTQGYVTLGFGPYRRDVELTQTALFQGIACDPSGACASTVFFQVRSSSLTTTRRGWDGASA